MKINNIKNAPLTFESKKLYTAKVFPKSNRGNGKLTIDAFITEIGVDDIPEPYTSEHKRLYTDFGENIINWIHRSTKERKKNEVPTFYALEVPNKKGKCKIRAMAMATELKKKKTMYIDYIQAFDSPSGNRQVKGAGSCLLYAIIDKAQKLHSLIIDLFAIEDAKDFYRKNGFIDGKFSHFELSSYRYPILLRTLKKKYSIQSIINK